jgi:hypothetical protein
VRAGLALAVALGSVAVVLHQAGRSTGSSAQTRQRSAPVASAPAAPTTEGTRATQPARQTGPARLVTSYASARAEALDQLAYLANFGHPLQNNLRGAGTTPTCPQIPLGDDPAARVTAALRRHMHSVVPHDSSVTMNADATLCGLNVRARAAGYAHVIVEIVAPPHAAYVGLRAQRRSGDHVLQTVSITTDGWQISIGWAGATAQGPSDAVLAAIARDRHLRW